MDGREAGGEGRLLDDGRPADGLIADRRSDVGACEWSSFGPSTVVTELNSTSDEWDPSLSADGRSIYFVSWRAGGLGEGDIWLATRSQPTGPFSVPVHQAALSSNLWDAAPFISSDGLDLFLCSSRTGSLGSSDLWASTRSDIQAAFGAPQHLAGLSSSVHDCGPVLSPDGKTIYFNSARPGGMGANDIFTATRSSPTASFGPPSAMAVLNAATDDFMGTVTGDGLEFYLTSLRAGGRGQLDIWVARRPSTGAPWATPANVEELNTPADDLAPTLTPDQRTIYYVRDSDTSGKGPTRLATRSCN